MKPTQRSTLLSCDSLRVPAFAMAVICVLTTLAIQSAQAQTFSVIHNFTVGCRLSVVGETPHICNQQRNREPGQPGAGRRVESDMLDLTTGN